MNSKEDDNFEDQWQRAFADASEQPSAALWERIEQQLDKDDKKIVPFWYKLAKYAAVALILVALGGYWSMKQAQKQIAIEVSQPTKKQVIVGNKISEKIGNNKNTAIQPINIFNKKSTVKKYSKHPENINSKSEVGTYSKRTENNNSKSEVGTYSERPENINSKSEVGTYSIRPENINSKSEVGTYSTRPENINSKPEVGTYSERLKISELEIKDIKNLAEPTQNQLVVSFEEQLLIKDPVIFRLTHWIHFGAGIASFNPHVNLPPSNSWLPYSYSNVQQKPIVSNLNEGTTPSFLAQISAGMIVRGRLGIESGIGFLMGNSVYETTILTIDNQRFSAISDVIYNSSIVSNLSNKQLSSQSSINFNPVPATNGDFSTQKVRNDYQFIQIPLLLSYDLKQQWPARKTGVVVTAGITNSIMIQNRIQNIYLQDVIYKNGTSSPYYRLSFASTFGLRGSYKLSQKWATTLTANYQRTIQSLEKTNIYFTTKPQLFSLGLGLQYQF
jgi:hypothetical protein